MLRIGIDLGGTKIEGLALDQGTEVSRIRMATPRHDYDATLAAIASLVFQLEQRAKGTGTIGIGIPGAISPATGLVKNANSTWLIGRPLLQDLEMRLGRPVRIANDANCFTISEASDGAAAGVAVAFGVILGTGVGGGVAISGRVLTGPNALAGEWGHNPLPWPGRQETPGPECYCGRRGCIEQFLSGPALEADYARDIVGLTTTGETSRSLQPASGDAASGFSCKTSEMGRTARDIVALAVGGDATASAVLARYEHRLARALAGVINLIDPDTIVLGGGMSNIESLYTRVPPLLPAFVFGAHGRRRREPPDAVRTRLVRARYGDSSGVRGAAWLWN